MIKSDSLQKPLIPKLKESRGDFDITHVRFKQYFGIKLKPLCTLANLLAIPLNGMMATMVGTFVNTQMVFILRDVQYFNVPHETLG
jgi:hypothetical protein